MDELERIRQAVNAVGLPEYVREVKCHLDEDWAGDPAVYIYLILADEVLEDTSRTDEVFRLTQAATWAAFESDIDRTPYVSVRGESEERELVEH